MGNCRDSHGKNCEQGVHKRGRGKREPWHTLDGIEKERKLFGRKGASVRLTLKQSGTFGDFLYRAWNSKRIHPAQFCKIMGIHFSPKNIDTSLLESLVTQHLPNMRTAVKSKNMWEFSVYMLELATIIVSSCIKSPEKPKPTRSSYDPTTTPLLEAAAQVKNKLVLALIADSDMPQLKQLLLRC